MANVRTSLNPFYSHAASYSKAAAAARRKRRSPGKGVKNEYTKTNKTMKGTAYIGR